MCDSWPLPLANRRGPDGVMTLERMLNPPCRAQHLQRRKQRQHQCNQLQKRASTQRLAPAAMPSCNGAGLVTTALASSRRRWSHNGSGLVLFRPALASESGVHQRPPQGCCEREHDAAARRRLVAAAAGALCGSHALGSPVKRGRLRAIGACRSRGALDAALTPLRFCALA